MEELTIEVSWETLPLILLTIAVAVVGVARLTRIAVYDSFPPAVAFRTLWQKWTDGTGWEKLAVCWWCFSVWVAALAVGWYIAGLFVAWIMVAWWIFWGTLALAYLAPMLIVRDGDDG